MKPFFFSRFRSSLLPPICPFHMGFFIEKSFRMIPEVCDSFRTLCFVYQKYFIMGEICSREVFDLIFFLSVSFETICIKSIRFFVHFELSTGKAKGKLLNWRWVRKNDFNLQNIFLTNKRKFLKHLLNQKIRKKLNAQRSCRIITIIPEYSRKSPKSNDHPRIQPKVFRRPSKIAECNRKLSESERSSPNSAENHRNLTIIPEYNQRASNTAKNSKRVSRDA